MPCPALDVLLVTDDDLTDELREHLAVCLRCRVLRGRLLERSPEESVPALSAGALEKEPTKRRSGSPTPALGSVYSIHGPLQDEYLIGALVDWDDEEAVVVPLSDAVLYATNWDILLEQSVLGYATMAEVWNHGAVMTEQLVEKLGELGEATEALSSLYAAALESDDVPSGLPVGPPVLGDADPRLVFQAEEVERASSYWEPATLLAGVETLGELVQLQREELGVERRELSQLIPEDEFAALERDRLDLVGKIEPRAFAGVLKALHLAVSSRLRNLILEAARAMLPTDPYEGATGFAAYRTRRVSGRSRDQTARRERRAESWVSDVIEEMKR
jgi:hypothetical protein